jgi:EmrB/QacA subfamily drug resistance transporter
MSAAVMEQTSRKPWLVLIATTGGLSMVMLDQTIVTVSLPTMMRDIPLSAGGAHWVVSAYVLAMAALVALSGRIGDWLGAVTAFRIGVILFFLASCGCGLVPTGAHGEPILLLFRALQGAGAALMLPASQSVVTSAFPLEMRGRALAVYVGVGQIFLAIGPLLGGFLTETVSWRSVFWLNVPVGLATLILVHLVKPDNHANDKTPSLPIAALLVAGMGLFILGVQEGPNFGWSSPMTLGSIIVGLLLLYWLVNHHWHSSDPLVDVRLVAVPGIAGDLLVLTLVQASMFGMVLYGTLYLQNVLHFAPLAAGAASLPLILGIAVGAQVGGRMFDHFGIRPPVLIGLTLAAIGTSAWALALLGSNYLWQLPGMLLAGLGLGLVQSPTGVDALSRAPEAERNQMSGLIQTLRQTGGTIGIAMTGAVVLTLEPAGSAAATARFPIAAAFGLSAFVLVVALAFAWLLLSRQRLTVTARDGSAG